MEKLQSYEQYSQVLALFKQGRARCATNKMMMRDELTALIEAGKLYYEQIGETLWFFSDEDYFYYAHLYAPADSPIQMEKQDKDVVVELLGNESRYNEQMDLELVAAGFEKGDRYFEYGAMRDEIIDDVKRQGKMMRAFWERRGVVFRKATKADYPELRVLWLDKIGADTYNVMALTDAQLEEMEDFGRSSLICDKSGTILAACHYYKTGNLAYPYITATRHPGSGLGACNYFVLIEQMYKEGCKKMLGWAREDNLEGNSIQVRSYQKKTGKFFWQFVCHA